MECGGRRKNVKGRSGEPCCVNLAGQDGFSEGIPARPTVRICHQRPLLRQGSLPRQYQPRNPHAAQCHYWRLQGVRASPSRAGNRPLHRPSPNCGPPPALDDQQRLGHVQDRGRRIETGARGLQHFGLRVTEAENGLITVNLMREQTYESVLMDVQMPEMDGIDATREIRKFDTTTPIVALGNVFSLTSNIMLVNKNIFPSDLASPLPARLR
jgi:Response regulator receiver domain